MLSPEATFCQIVRVDATNALLFLYLALIICIAFAANVVVETTESKERGDVLAKLAEIIRRDTGIHPSTANLSASAVEFGLTRYFGAEVRDGASLVLEASNIMDAISRGEFSEPIVCAPNLKAIENDSLFCAHGRALTQDKTAVQ